ncbi:hypothetical protein SAMN04490190_5127 [Pseudomonas libanensis]|uniref:hypothetical protein n=1 Tax=Pseudomonas libanensis TaxID=75588 RepID=UPI00087C8DCD|nr:hypothetical protein [Pseudomonas libanensis]SDL43929.1 hypothetical protein SAMN04490190_5127 [Pseudomonas libanensis]
MDLRYLRCFLAVAEGGEPVLIEMTGGRTVYVTRCEARDVVKGNMRYLDHDISHAYAD